MTDDGRRTKENWGLTGHEWAVQMLKQHVMHASVRHAYLFCGPPGVGRRTLALRLVQALNCPQPLSAGEPCGKCRTCRQIERMQYADLAVIQAEKEGGVLKVEQIRTVLQSLALTPYQGKYRVALFLRFQEANASAANALLKTLEEAPPKAILILTADTPEQLLPTIPSRCEILRLRPLPVETVETLLKESGADETKARFLAHISGGRPGYALRLMQDDEALAFRKQRLEDLQNLLKSTRRARFAYADKLTRRKRPAGEKTTEEDGETENKIEAHERFRNTLQVWLSFWRDVLLRTSGSDVPIANIDCSLEIEDLAGKLSLDQVHRLVSAAEDTLEKLERNINARLLAEVLLLDWPRE
jgi:DNA polymerase-3 subunit delta'